MGRPADVYNAFRRRILPGIHGTLDLLLGGYALSDTPSEEYVATLDCPESDVEELLADLGFSRNLFASLKVRADGNVSDGSWVYRESLLADHQLHAILHETDAGTEMYAHWEYSSIRHPYQHYLARHYSAEKGVAKMHSTLDELGEVEGIDWTIEPTYQRHTWYVDLLHSISRGATERVFEVPKRFRDGLTPESPGLVQRAASRLG